MASDYASKVLGAALLQGWTMSAEECQNDYCPGCPLMVSKDGKESFCARCDGGDKVGLPRQGLVEPLATSLSSTLNSETRVSSPTSSRAADEVTAEEDEDIYEVTGRDTIPNTPPTPHSRLNTPPPLPPTLQTLDPQVQAARRAQTDRASSLLAQKMLQGWTLLGEECSNETCHAVPLMRRPPVTRATKDGEEASGTLKLVDPRRHCVICQRDYVREGDVKAYEDFMEAISGKTPSTSTANATTKRGDSEEKDKIVHSAAAKKRRFSTQPPTSSLNTSKVMGFGTTRSDLKGKLRAEATNAASPVTAKATSTARASAVSANPSGGSATSTGTTQLLQSIDEVPQTRSPPRETAIRSPNAAIAALEMAVDRLTKHLSSACAEGAQVDVAQIAWTSEALARSCKALEDVKDLYR
ncbi:hypothetical protein P389DRAFT_66621 [Cystobasidium minutum MCA 4210]|uniref:uncharacterized protein n=1 Tax=Cystobasidium minutum MCA 4210 TaxID=1397322 RepID=UPI0034CFA310|eukprot:jgi/Rhomi1/66621/CE66620_1178